MVTTNSPKRKSIRALEGDRYREGVWIVPTATMKMKRPHRVPLSRQAIVILRELHGLTGQGEYVFPAVDSIRRPMSNNTLNAALRRLGYAKEEVSVSGFRATASTLLNEMGRWNPDAIERQLAHMEENDVRRAYMHAAEFLNERVEMMQVWADYLDQLRHGSSADEGVRPFARSQRAAFLGSIKDLSQVVSNPTLSATKTLQLIDFK
jgi:integrase